MSISSFLHEFVINLTFFHSFSVNFKVILFAGGKNEMEKRI